MPARLQTILDTVNQYLCEGHGTGIFDPTTMELTRKANCFGRLAVFGAAVQDEMPTAEVELLIARHHGMKYVSSNGATKRWRAHAEMVVKTAEGDHLIDTPPFQNKPPIITDTYALERKPEEGIAVHPARDPRELDLPEDQLQRQYGPPDIRALHHVFDVYRFTKGLVAYQTGAGSSTVYSEADYLEVYRRAQAEVQADPDERPDLVPTA